MSTKNKSQLARIFIAYARKHKCIISPKLGYLHFVKNYLECGCCPCRPDRKNCPCPEATKEIATEGHCTCGLFYRDLEAFLATEPTLNIKEVKIGDKS